jgi:hypothetical protein
MFERLEKLRTKPKHIRDRYAFWLSAGVTLCIFGIWATTLPPRLAVLRDGGSKLADDNSNSTWSRASAAVRSSWSGWDAESNIVPIEEKAATSTDAENMEWTTAAESTYINSDQSARTILIGTSSAVVASTSSSTNVLQ